MPSIKLAGDNTAPGLARQYIGSILDERTVPAELRERVYLVASELVTNSVLHGGRTPITVEVAVRDGAVIDLTITDEGPGFALLPRAPGHAETHGWGLVFVDMLSESWAAGGVGAPVVWTHFEPRAIDEPEPAVDPLLEERLLDLLDVRILLDSVKDYAIFAVDRSGVITLWNAGGERLTGYSADEVLGKSVAQLQGAVAVSQELAAALAYGRHEDERWIYRKDGSRFWGDLVTTPILGRTGVLRGFSVVARDVTWRKQIEEEREGLMVRIKQLARTDDLTGLPNRRHWHEELDRELARARRRGTQLCVAQIDLDEFKAYNDSRGHVDGDRMLAQTAAAWATTVRETDTLGRTGGDEFSLLLPECAVDEATEVVERLRQATPAPMTCSAGVASSDGGESAEAVVRRADSALYAAKGRRLMSGS